VAQRATGLLPDRVAQKITDVAAIDRLDALHVAVKAVGRGGTVSVSGVYGGEVDPMPMMEMFDRGIQLRMGQAHVKRWIGYLMPMVADGSDPTANADRQDMAARSLCALGRAHGIDTDVHTQPGGHDWQFAAEAFAAALPWLAATLGASGNPAPMDPHVRRR